MTVAVAALLSLAVPAQAGTEAAPEVTDADDDSTSPVPGADIVLFWIDDALGATSDGKPALALHLTLAGDINHRPALFAFSERFRVSFVASNPAAMQGAAELYVNIAPSNPSQSVQVTSVPNPTAESVSCKFGRAPAAGASADIPAEATLEPIFPSGTHFGCLLPLETLGAANGDKLTGFVIHQQLVTRGPLSGGDDIEPRVLGTFDTAPDSGAGLDYAIAGGSSGSAAPVYTVLTGATVTNTTRFAAATTQATQFNWTSALRAGTVALDVQGVNGTLSFVVLDGANQTVLRKVFAPGGNLTQAFEGAAPGDWRILVNATSFEGNVTFSIGPTASPSGSQTGSSSAAPGSPGKGPTGTAGPGSGAGGNGTSSGTTSAAGKDTASPGLLAGLAAVAVAVLASRRRGP